MIKTNTETGEYLEGEKMTKKINQNKKNKYQINKEIEMDRTII